MKSKNVSWSIYIRNGTGRRLAQLGGLIGSDQLIYNRFVMSQFHDEAVANAPRVIPAILDAFPESHRFLDVGSGGGAFSAELKRRGKSVVALERSPHGRGLAAQQGIDCRDFDLTRVPATTISEPFDVCFCFEVAEHLPPELGGRLVEFIAGFGAAVLFSAALPGQGGTGHINEQPCEYWVSRFEKLGFTLDGALTQRLRKAFAENRASRWFQNNPFVMRPGK